MEQSVATVIFNGDRSKVLLIKRRDVPVWVLPGGGIEPNETPDEAALREAIEETALQLSLKRKVATYTPINRLALTTHFYEAVIESGTPKVCSETSDIAFFPIDKLPYHMPPPYSDWIKDALTHTSEIEKTISSVKYSALIKFIFKHPILVFRFLLARLGKPINSQ